MVKKVETKQDIVQRNMLDEIDYILTQIYDTNLDSFLKDATLT